MNIDVMQKKMNRRRNLARLIVAIGVVVAATTAYFWLRPPTAVDRLKYALGLDDLPVSLSIQGEGTDIWTDYITLHSVTLKSEDFPALLKGRDFKQPVYFRAGLMEHDAEYAARLPSVDVAIRYDAQESPPDGPVCRIYANEARTEVFIEYLAD
ncbi:hypothetical protein [Lignipirellula cremea]|uniref:Uncharacterized protein n=1 Tax=Lignipirellula cremea TaxID=2528010 RepID=A0A518DY91_9BACT|nr:hypothetical protein [Lignipirellula cremea]QDU96794.1 hypothetical protein Pla8534_46150 [Lignipirellula cremea]